jgi:hypothetical protein
MTLKEFSHIFGPQSKAVQTTFALATPASPLLTSAPQNPKAAQRGKRSRAAMGYQDAPGGGGKLSLASVGFAGPGAGAGGGGYKELLVMALPQDDGLDGAKVAEAIGVRLPDLGGAVRVRKFPPDFTCFQSHVSGAMEGTRISILAGYSFFFFLN